MTTCAMLLQARVVVYGLLFVISSSPFSRFYYAAFLRWGGVH